MALHEAGLAESTDIGGFLSGNYLDRFPSPPQTHRHPSIPPILSPSISTHARAVAGNGPAVNTNLRHPLSKPSSSLPPSQESACAKPSCATSRKDPYDADIQQTDSEKGTVMACTEELFSFSKVSLGDFERCLAFVETHTTLDYRAAADKMLWQAYKTFERLHRRDFDDRHLRLVQLFANQCVQQYALLDFGADCGVENLKKYLHGLVLTSDWYRKDYLNRMIKLPPPNRLEFIQRPVPSYLEKLKWFCLLYDHLYEKIEQEARAKSEKTILDRFQTKLEGVQARISRGATSTLNSLSTGSGNGNESRSRGQDLDRNIGNQQGSSYFVGRAL